MKKFVGIVLTLALICTLVLTGCQAPAPAASETPAAPASEAPAAAPASEAPATTEAPASAAPASEEPAAEAPASGEQILIGGSIMTLAYPWFLGAQEGMENWAKDNPDANVKFQFEDSNMDVQTAITKLENMASAGAKGIVIFPPDAKATIPTMVDLNKNKDIKFVVGDYPQEPDSPDQAVWETFVGHDMKALGIAAGEVAVEYLKTLGKDDPTLLFISRPQSGQVSEDRVAGFSETVMAAFPNAKIIVEGDTGAGDKNSAQDLMDNVLQREKTIDVVSGHNDAEVLGAYNAAMGADRAKDMKFIGIAGDKEVLGFIQDTANGAWIGEILQDPVVLGYTATDALWKAMNGEELPEKYELPKPEAITPANIGEYDWQNWAWLG